MRYYDEDFETLFKRVFRKITCLEKALSNVSGSGYKYIADSYNALILTTPNQGDFAYVKNSQGTAWLPGNLGGTYYPLGVYFYDGSNWINDKSQIALELQQDNIAFANLEALLNAHLIDYDNPHNTPTSGGDIITNVLTADSVDAYYRGFNRNGIWEIEKFIEGDLSTKTVATQGNNLLYGSITVAWSNRGILNYI